MDMRILLNNYSKSSIDQSVIIISKHVLEILVVHNIKILQLLISWLQLFGEFQVVRGRLLLHLESIVHLFKYFMLFFQFFDDVFFPFKLLILFSIIFECQIKRCLQSLILIFKMFLAHLKCIFEFLMSTFIAFL